MVAHCSSTPRKTSHSYYVCMLDYGKRGLEAIVDPEVTRRGVIDRIASGEWDRERVAFIHFVDGLFIEDCSAEILAEAHTLALEAAE